MSHRGGIETKLAMREHRSPLHLLGLTATAIALALGACANPAPALANTATTQPLSQPTSPASPRALEHHRQPPTTTVLAIGSGFATPHGSPLVRVLQRDLKTRGYPPSPIDGLYGPLTRHAVSGFQAAHDLQIDGIVGPRTWTALTHPAPIPGPRARDQAGGENTVRTLQRSSRSAGDSPGPIDGRYGRLHRARRSHASNAHAACPPPESPAPHAHAARQPQAIPPPIQPAAQRKRHPRHDQTATRDRPAPPWPTRPASVQPAPHPENQPAARARKPCRG